MLTGAPLLHRIGLFLPDTIQVIHQSQVREHERHQAKHDTSRPKICRPWKDTIHLSEPLNQEIIQLWQVAVLQCARK